MTPPALRALLQDSLALWGVDGRVSVAGDGVTVAVAGVHIGVAPAPTTDLPIRWWVQRGPQRRPCTSVLGLLRTLRNAAGGGEARRLQVVP